MTDLPPMLIPPSQDALLTRAVERLPERMREGFLLFVRFGVPPGSFLQSVLSNDLREACRRADPVNAQALHEYIVILVNYAPADCWGSREAVRAWIDKGMKLRRWGQMAETETER